MTDFQHTGPAEGISAILLSWRRTHNIPRIVQSLQSIKVVREIIIWNNNPQLRLRFPNCIVINSSHNFMPFARYGAACLTACDTVLFQDDDMLFDKAGVEQAYDELKKDGSRIYGSEGRNLEDGKYNTAPAFGPCDIVLGQFMLFRKQLLIDVFDNILRLTPFQRGDDIAFCLLAGGPHMALNLPHTDLGKSDGAALYRQKGHLERRQMMIDRVTALKAERAREK